MKKILVVDDSRGWLNFHQTALNEIYGDSICIEMADSARAGYDAIYANLKEPYALIISDLQMELDFEPLHAGEWFIEQVQKMTQYRNVPIIIVSASYNVRSIAHHLGVDCLPKNIAINDKAAYRLAIEEALM